MFDGDMVTVPQQHQLNVQRTQGIGKSHGETIEITTITKTKLALLVRRKY